MCGATTPSKATRAVVEANGGKIVEELMVPQNTRDFSAYLLKLQQIKPQRGGHGGGRRRHQGAAPAGRAAQDAPDHGLDQQPAGLARRVRPGPGCHLRRVRHHLVLPPEPAGREGVRRRLPEAVSRHGDPRAGQRLSQRLHGHARAAALCRGSGHDQQHRRHQEAGGPQDDGGGPAAAPRRLDRPRHPPLPADHLHGELQRPAGGKGRHLQDPFADRPQGGGRTRTPRPPASWRATRPRPATKSERAADG